MISLSTLALLALTALVAGFVDSIAGGGGLLCLPALMLSVADPVTALATNKLQGTFGTASATATFWQKGLLKPKEHLATIFMVFIGAALGVGAVGFAPKQFLNLALPPLLILIALYFAFAPRLSDGATEQKLPAAAFTYGLAPLIGFYDGIFGPGTGSFFMLSLVTFFSLGLVEATGRTKLFNFTSNIAALMIFAHSSKILWATGLVMGAAQLIGAQLGARLAIKNGATIIRPLLVIVSLAMAAKLLWAR
jgi:uncharacterized membrane protein YfcA